MPNPSPEAIAIAQQIEQLIQEAVGREVAKALHPASQPPAGEPVATFSVGALVTTDRFSGTYRLVDPADDGSTSPSTLYRGVPDQDGDFWGIRVGSSDRRTELLGKIDEVHLLPVAGSPEADEVLEPTPEPVEPEFVLVDDDSDVNNLPLGTQLSLSIRGVTFPDDRFLEPRFVLTAQGWRSVRHGNLTGSQHRSNLGMIDFAFGPRILVNPEILGEFSPAPEPVGPDVVLVHEDDLRAGLWDYRDSRWSDIVDYQRGHELDRKSVV